MKVPVIEHPAAPVFVVGMNGSGTSMLTESLGRHPELYAFPGETRMIPHFIAVAPKFGDFDNDDNFHEFWSYIVSSTPDFEIFNDHTIPDLPDNWRDFPRNLPSILDAIFRQFALPTGKSRWCEKSPNNTEHMITIGKLFPQSRFIHIIRDGRDCAASTNRRQHRDPELAVFRWRQVVAEARRQGMELGGRYFELKYEDLTQDPEPWMRQVCAFLDLRFDPHVLESSMPQSEKRIAPTSTAVGRIEPNSQKFLRYFTDDQLRKLELISGEFLAELGYPVFHEAGSRDFGWLRAKTVRLADFVRSNQRLRKKLSGDSDISWYKIGRAMRASVREYLAKKY